MNSYYRVFIMILTSLQVISALGQSFSTDVNGPVQLDKSIFYGKLDNGLSYYIKHLPEGEKVNLRFYVLAGINHQDPDQLNMAHFVEHMGFKSSKNFPNGIFRELLERKNLDMSQRDINGTAGPYHTRYKFDAPVDNQEAVKTGLLWFKDIANGLSLKDEEIDTERGVLIQELISRTPANMEVAFAKNELKYQLIPRMENYSNFIEHHKSFDPNRLRQFYKDWYRPVLMSIVIVGKIDNLPALEKYIRTRFSDIKPNKNPREIPDYDALYFDQSPQFVVVEKPEDSKHGNKEVEIEIFIRDRTTLDEISSKKGFQRTSKNGLLVKILNDRLREASTDYNSFFNFEVIHTHGSPVTSHPSSFKVRITARHNREKEALRTFTHIFHQLQKHGVLDSEFIEAKKEKDRELHAISLYESRYWLEQIENNLVHKEALPNNKRENIENWLSNYDKKEFNEFIKEIGFDLPVDIGILAPPDHPALTYTEAEIRSLISNIVKDTISPYLKPEIPTTLLTSDEIEGFRKSGYHVRELGAGTHELILENGLKLILKPIETSNPEFNQIILHGFRNRGALSFPPEDYFSAINAPLFIHNSGIGKFNKFQLQRFKSNINLSYLNIYVNNLESGIKLNGDPKDLEEILQMVYLFFSQPRKDSLAFQDWKMQQFENYHRRDSDKTDLDNNIKKIIGDNSDISIGTERYLGLEETDMERGFEVYKEIFGNPQNFTFLVVGDFTMDSVIPLLNKYLGNLPSPQLETLPSSSVNSYVAKPTGPVLIKFKSPDLKNQSRNNFTYKPSFIIHTKNKVDWKEKLIARALGGLLSVKIGELRNEKGYSLYSVGAAAKFNNHKNQHEFGATIKCLPEQYPLLQDEFSRIIDSLKNELVSEEELEQALRRIRVTEDPSGRGHSLYNIHKKLYNQYRFDLVWVEQKEIMAFINLISPEDMLKAAQNYFRPENLYEFVITY